MESMNASDWMKGIFFSVLASIVGAGSKLAIRKSWLMEEDGYYNDCTSLENSLADRSVESLEQIEEEEQLEEEPVHHRGPHSPTSKGSNPNEPQDAEPREHDKPNSRRHLLADPNIYTAVEPQSPAASTRTDVVDIESTPIRTHTLCCCCFKKYCTIPKMLRLSGMVGMSILNPICGVLAMNYASPSILAPFSGLTLVWVIVLSQPLIGEFPSFPQKIASLLIIIGEVTVAVFGDHTNDEGTSIEKVKASYHEPLFLAYFVGIGLWMLLLALFIQFPRYSSPTLRRFAWGTSGGSLTGLAQCFIKDSLEVLKLHVHWPWWQYFFVFNAGFWSFIGLLFLTATMKRYDATYSAAMFVGSFVVSTSIMSALHYQTFQHLADWTDWILYPFGLLTLMIGVGILVQKGSQQQPEPEFSSPRENRAYSDVFANSDSDVIFDDDDNEIHGAPVETIPEASSVSDTTLTERPHHDKSQFTADELELV